MVETEKLRLIPLTYSQLVQYANGDSALETELNVSPSSRIISPELKEALEETILPNVAVKGKNYLFSTLWTIILKSENKMVGDLCFVGEPNEAGEIEIGYGTYESFRQKGFMTEAVQGIIGWAALQPNVKAIIASTEKTNTASFVVLQKNQFISNGETETLYKWRLQVAP